MSGFEEKIKSAISSHDKVLRNINQKIHDKPELAYAEFEAHKNIVALLKAEGIEKITPHSYGLETSFEAEFGQGGRLVVFNVEYDALPGIGHACGHNLIATASIASFLAVVDLLKKSSLPGRVRALGTPAEEGGGGKIKLIEAGAFEGVDACLMCHPMGGDVYDGTEGIAFGSCTASTKFKAAFSGRTAHAGASPQDGINALDAAVLTYSAISMLRQQILPTQRIHGIVVEGGERSNIIPGHSVMDYGVRGETLNETRVLQERVFNCFKGAALASGCTVEFSPGMEYAEILPNRSLCAAYSESMTAMGRPQFGDDSKKPIAGSYSTDQGNVTHICPGFHPVYKIPTIDGQSNHTKEFTDAAITEEAYQVTLLSARAMASTAWKVLSDDAFAKAVHADFDNDKAKN